MRFEYSNCDKDNDTSASYSNNKVNETSYNHNIDQSSNSNNKCDADKSRTKDLSEISFGGFSEPSSVSRFSRNYDFEVCK